MDSTETVDVIVVGAGPAGSTVSRMLAASGLSVVALDSRLPHETKTCAGGILERAIRRLPVGLKVNWADSGIREVTTCSGEENSFTRTTASSLFRTVDRRDFDNALADLATTMGARVLRGQRVTHIEAEDQYVSVTTDQNLVFLGKVLVGADGACSTVARLVRGKEARTPLGTVEAAISQRVVPQSMTDFEHHMRVSWGAPPGGYTWIFPQGDHLSVGAGGVGVRETHLLRESVERAVLRWCDTRPVEKPKVGFVPIYQRDARRTRGRVLLVGDAALLADRFVREGISWALWSAELAAEAICTFLSGKSELDIYQYLLEKDLLPELDAAAGIAQWFYSDTQRGQRWLRGRVVAWPSFCSLFSNDVNHRTLYEALLSAKGRYPLGQVRGATILYKALVKAARAHSQ